MPLPTVGGSLDTWGTEMNAWALIEHNSDGTHAVVSLQGGAKLYSGTGVPSAGTGVDGDWYLRKGGAAGSRLYQKVSGAWQAIAETSPAVQDEGIAQGSAGTLNFTGAGVTASVSGGVATVNVPGGGGGGASLPNLPERIVASAGAPANVRALADAVCDNTADNLEIQAILDAGYSVRLVGATAGTAATFTISASLTRKFDGQWIRGEGIDATKLVLANSTNAMAITNTYPAGSGFRFGGGVADLSIDGNMNNQTAGGGVSFDTCYFAEAHNLRILNTFGYALRFHTTAARFNAYSKALNVTAAVGLGRGIVVDDSTEFIELYGCNASYFQGGTIATNYYDDVSDTAGLGLYLRGGNNTVVGGHFDRCRVPIYLFFSHGNRLYANTDNALDTAVFVKGSRRNTFVLHIGRCDPLLADGATVNTRYDLNQVESGIEGRAVNIQNNSGGNTFQIVQHPDTNQPGTYTGTLNADGDNPFGGWIYTLGENSGAGATAYDGPNRVLSIVPSIVRVKLDGARTAYELTANATLTNDQAGWLYGGDFTPVILCNPSAGALTLTLPDADVAWGREFRFVNIHATQNAIIQAGSGDSIQQGSITLTPGQDATIRGPADQYGRSSQWLRVSGGAADAAVSTWRSGVGFKSMFGTARRGDIPTAAQMTTNAIAGLYNWPSTVTALPEATVPLATQLSGITAGTQKRILPGVYREAVPTLTVANLRLYAYGDVAITGMDRWSVGSANTWSTAAAPNNANGSFVSSLTVPTFTVDTDSPLITSALLAAPEQVMVDGVMFNKVAAGSTLAVGQWMLDGSRHVVLRTADSAVIAHKIEVTTRQNWCAPGTGATNLTLDGIYFYGSASGAATAAPLQQNSQANFTIRNCMIGFTHGIAVAGGGAAGLKVLDNVFHNIGSAAIISGSSGTLISGNIGFNCAGTQNTYSGALDQSGYNPTWGSCFTKVVTDYTTIRDNIVWNIGFASYWQDVLCRYGSIFNNVAWDGRTANIAVEVSSYFKVYGNHIFQTDSTQFPSTPSQGIDISSSRDGDLGPDLDAGEEPNIVMRIGTAYKAGWQGTRNDLPPSNTLNQASGGFRRVRVHDNIAILRKTGGQGPGGPDVAIQWSELSGPISVGTATTSESGTTATYTVANNLHAGDLVTVTGCSVAGYNVTNATVVTATSGSFTLTLGVSGLGAGTGAVVVTGNGSSIADASNTGWHNLIGFGNGVDNVTGMTWADDFIFLSDVTGLAGQHASGWFYNVTEWNAIRWDTGTDVDGRTHKSRMLTFAEQQAYLNMYGLPPIS